MNTFLKQLKMKPTFSIRENIMLSHSLQYRFAKKSSKQKEYRYENDTYILEDSDTGFKPSEKLSFVNVYYLLIEGLSTSLSIYIL